MGAQLEPPAIIEKLYPKKPSFRPSKWPHNLKTTKNSKLPKLPENCFELVGKGGWPLISTWINGYENGTNNTTECTLTNTFGLTEFGSVMKKL